MSAINAYASPDAHVIYGAAYDDTLGDAIRVTVVATGLNKQNTARRTAPPLQVLRTGTDNMPIHNAGMGLGGNMPSLTSVGQGSSSTPDYQSMSVPSVWRRPDRTAATQRVDALSAGGMDDFEIPAFLRKQAD